MRFERRVQENGILGERFLGECATFAVIRCVPHEIVHRWPEKFIRDGVSDDEKVQARRRIRPEPEPTQRVPMATAPKPLLDENAVLCVRAVFGASDGDTHLGQLLAVAVGTRLSKDGRIVKTNPPHFVPVVPPGRTRENSVHALADWAEYRKRGDGSFIEETDFVRRQRFGEFKKFILFYRGQYVDRTDPIVRSHPGSFEAIL